MKVKCMAAIERYDMLSEGDSIIVGLSGGADSSALLHFLCGIRQQFKLNLTAVHVNHMIRGEEAERDELASQKLCDSLNVNFKVYREDVPAIAAEKKLGIEECGREIRYGIFEREAESCKGKIAVAHTLSDSVETVLLHMIRGCAVNGLKGIAPVRGNIIRPLILCEREDIERYCLEHNIEYITDSSNLSTDYARNKIRLEIMPGMKEINPSFVRSMARLEDCAEKDDDYMNEIAEAAAGNYLNCNSTGALQELDDAILRRALIIICKTKQGIIPEHRHVLEMCECLRQGAGSVNLPGGVVFKVSGESISFLTKNGADMDNDEREIAKTWKADVSVGEIITPFGQKIYASVIDKKKYDDIFKFNKNVFQNSLNYDIIKNNSAFRFRRVGDSFRQAGRGNTKSLKKLFNELKISPQNRAKIPLLECDGREAWIPGVGSAEGFQVTDTTRRIMHIETVPALSEEEQPCGDISRIIFDEAAIKNIVGKLADEINRDYQGKNPLLVGILKGSVFVLSDIARAISLNCEIDFMIVSSYSGAESRGSIAILQDLRTDICGRDVLIVEDIIDSGVTLKNLTEILLSRNPASLKICAFLDKPSGRRLDIRADYVGAEIENEFVVGYGLDYNEKYRNLPYLGVLNPSVYSVNK